MFTLFNFNLGNVGLMRFAGVILLCLAAVTVACTLTNERVVTVVVSPVAQPPEVTAAQQLCFYLGRIYPGTRFRIQEKLTGKGSEILLGTPASMPERGEYVAEGELGGNEESFVVKAVKKEGRELGIIVGNSPRALIYAVYKLLQRLGCGFYLSYETLPQTTEKAFSFDQWDLADEPLVGERIVFNWHNFLSGCSSWNLPEWQSWIAQGAKMGFNAVMVHAYGNNPMFSFTHNGQTKPAGFLTTTSRGRDWSTEHVNDVRRIFGGKGIFDSPVFGSNAAQVPADKRVEAASELMRQVFDFTGLYGMRVCFALDVDTRSANPQNIIMTLPQSARFRIKFQDNDFFLANPDSPEGFAYYRAQINALLNLYPGINRLVAWFRRPNTTPWLTLEEKDFPQSWRAEYQAGLNLDTRGGKSPATAGLFAVSKIVGAFRRALDRVGREDVELAIGTWGLDRPWFKAADPFFPKNVSFIGLDYSTEFETEVVQQNIEAVSAERKIIPVVWAHHDDRAYIGRPYTPYADFASLLQASGSAGFGIIHWTTRPLDIYFKSLADQVWRRTADQPLQRTVDEIAGRSFGAGLRDSMGKYLYRWVTDAPQFGRETTERFIDRPLEQQADTVISKCRERLKLLERIDESPMEPEALSRLRYFKLMERFFIEFYRCQQALERSESFYKEGDISSARAEIRKTNPEEVLELYARLSSLGEGITRGEKGLLVSMNLRWLPYFTAQRQVLRLEPLRFNFKPTQHEPLAQYRGKKTYYFDSGQSIWMCLGEEETGAKAFSALPRKESADSVYEEICLTGIESPEPVSLVFKSFASGNLAPGLYNVHLLFAEPEVNAAGQRVFDVFLKGTEDNSRGAKPLLTERVDIFQRTGARNKVFTLTRPVRIDQGRLELELRPVRGKTLICGIVIEPAGL